MTTSDFAALLRLRRARPQVQPAPAEHDRLRGASFLEQEPDLLKEFGLHTDQLSRGPLGD
ncbi:MAG TPA: hypothetical protein VE650_11915 [Acetobacteraceae bacterium]|nr:hypothetical protein [Acetobacteraceae bacterium]